MSNSPILHFPAVVFRKQNLSVADLKTPPGLCDRQPAITCPLARGRSRGLPIGAHRAQRRERSRVELAPSARLSRLGLERHPEARETTGPGDRAGALGPLGPKTNPSPKRERPERGAYLGRRAGSASRRASFQAESFRAGRGRASSKLAGGRGTAAS